jgi:hypothetical protein
MFHASTENTDELVGVESCDYTTCHICIKQSLRFRLLSGCMVGTVCQILRRSAAKVVRITWLLHIKGIDRRWDLDLPVMTKKQNFSPQMENDTGTQTSVGQNQAEVLSNISKKLSITILFNTKIVNQLLRQCIHCKWRNLLPIAGISHHNHAPFLHITQISVNK